MAVAGSDPSGGSDGWLTDVNGGRLWGMHNLLVTFDANGVVKSAATVPEKDLHPRLTGRAGGLAVVGARAPALVVAGSHAASRRGRPAGQRLVGG